MEADYALTKEASESPTVGVTVRTIGIVRKQLAVKGSWGDLSMNECAGRKMCTLTGSAHVAGKRNPTLCEEAGKSFS